MEKISGSLVATLARVWHRFDPRGQDLEGLAGMLAPMDEAGERLSERIGFDMEPADYLIGLDDVSGE